MQLKPVHKMSLVGALLAVMAAALLFAGYSWGASASRTEERLLSVKQNRSAAERMAAVAGPADEDGDDPEQAAAAQGQRLSKARYMAWLEQQLDAQTAVVAKLKQQSAQAAVTNAQYVEFARVLLTASKPAAQAERAQRAFVSKVSVQVLSEYWKDTYGAVLALPDDLFLRGLDTSAAPAGTHPEAATSASAAVSRASRLVVRAPAGHVSARESAGSTQVAAIRTAIEEFNRH